MQCKKIILYETLFKLSLFHWIQTDTRNINFYVSVQIYIKQNKRDTFSFFNLCVKFHLNLKNQSMFKHMITNCTKNRQFSAYQGTFNCIRTNKKLNTSIIITSHWGTFWSKPCTLVTCFFATLLYKYIVLYIIACFKNKSVIVSVLFIIFHI